MTRILQINLNRCRAAHDLMLHTAKHFGVEIVLITEPNKKKMDSQWVTDQRIDAGIKLLTRGTPLRKESANGFAWCDYDSNRIFSCYFSPNESIRDFEDALERLGACILESQQQSRNRGLLISGDFNAASVLWGSERTNNRGVILEEWIERLGLTVINTGVKPTFQRGKQQSFLDLTICNDKIKGKIRDWMVLEIESLSDHNYILYTLQDDLRSSNHDPNETRKILDLDKCRMELERRVRGKNFGARQLTEETRKACKDSMIEIPERRNRAYWFNQRIAELRRNCVKARRRSLRTSAERWEENKMIYREARNELNKAILSSKKQIWNDLCEEVSRNPWSTGYKIVMEKLRIQKTDLSKELIGEILGTLFPEHEHSARQATERRGSPMEFEPISDEELKEVSRKLATNKAPGPDKIPAKVTKLILNEFKEEYKRAMNNLIESRAFPKAWKRAQVALIQKPGKPAELPNSYRPICLLSTLGKSFESILNNRLRAELDRRDIISNNQFGFRKGRSTVQAIRKLTEKVEAENGKKNVKSRDLILAILIDVKNAFNSLSWASVTRSLERYGISEPLKNMIESYLSDRAIVSRGVNREMTAGVPQGSYLGPTLWNLTYNEVFELNLPQECEIIGYADDIVVVVKARSEELLEMRGNECIRLVDEKLKEMRLDIAPQKSEAIIFSRKHRIEPVRLHQGESAIQVRDSVKYLGITLDRKLTFVKHVKTVCEKAAKSAKMLNRILPRASGADEAKRKLLARVTEQIVSYGVQTWESALEYRTVREALEKTQRINAVRVSRAYRTVYTKGILVIGRLIPWEIKFRLRKEMREGLFRPLSFEGECLDRWQEQWSSDESTKGARIRKLIPDIRRWYHREHGELFYELTQFITGHGAFREFLKRIGKRDSPNCNLCEEQAVDTADHAIFHCSHFNTARERWQQLTHCQITENNVIDEMIKSPTAWKASAEFIQLAVSTKEALDRLEERTRTGQQNTDITESTDSNAPVGTTQR